MNGYAGKILRADLTHRKISAIPTSKYEQWVGGHGMGSAIFFDLVKDKTIDGYDPANIITIMTSPLSGTLVPAASGRTEVQGIGVQSVPIGWFTRSNFGGRFSPMLKYAGWDGIVIGGQADEPVWLDFLNRLAPGKIGSTGIAEPKFLKAVTGRNFTFLDGIHLGKKIWNLDHAVWTLQGRHREMVHFSDYLYSQPSFVDQYLPGRKNGRWEYINTRGRHFERDKFEEFKTRFYELQGWDSASGYPTGDTLKSLGLSYVADELARHGKLGKA